MELTPDLLLEAKFGSSRRGYDMAEVDDFLERCAEGLDVLLNRLRSEFERAEQTEAELVALRARIADGEPLGVAPAAPDTAEPEAVEPVPPEAPAAMAVGEPMRILIAAERTAEAAIADARAEAERIRTEAEAIANTNRSEAEQLLARAKADADAEARRAGDEAKRAIQSEVVSLRRDRDALTEDIRALRRWLDDQRGRLRTTARDLQRIAEDPSALRDAPLPELQAAADAGADPGDATADDPEADPGRSSADEWPAVPDDHEQAEDVDVVDVDVDHDGEATQAVPAVSGFRPFDDDRAGGAPADSVR